MKKFAIVLLFIVMSICQVCAQTRTAKVNLNFRNSNSTSSKVLDVIPQGASFQLLANCADGWCLVSYKGQTGYVHKDFLWDKQPSTQSGYSGRTYASARSWNSPTVRQFSHPAGATARCVDGTYSYSQHRQGTCSHHGGVAQWL